MVVSVFRFILFVSLGLRKLTWYFLNVRVCVTFFLSSLFCLIRVPSLSSEYEICNGLLGPDLSLFTRTVCRLHFVSAFQPGHHIYSARCEWSCGHRRADSQHPETVCCHSQRWVGACLSWSSFFP